MSYQLEAGLADSVVEALFEAMEAMDTLAPESSARTPGLLELLSITTIED